MTQEPITSIVEDNAEAFKRLATKRVNRALRHHRLIGNLSNRSNYAYTSSEIKKIFDALRQSLDEAEKLFQKQADNKQFTLE